MKKKLLFSVAIVLLMLAGCNSNSEPAKNTFAPSFDEVLTTRRSVRSYDATKKISETEVRELLLILLNQYLCNCKTAKQL